MRSKREGIAGLLPQVIFILIVGALIAAGLFLAIPILQSRPEYPEGTYPWTIGGTTLLVEMDPTREVYLIPLSGQGGQGGTGQPIPLPTLGAGPSPTPPPLVLPTIGPTATPVPPAVDSIIFMDYVVQQGDTLYSLSNRYVTSIPLMARFGISAASLVPGTVIRLPIGNPAYCTAGYKPYAVTEGETLSSIALKCGTTVADLQQANRLGSSTAIYVASVICVP